MTNTEYHDPRARQTHADFAAERAASKARAAARAAHAAATWANIARLIALAIAADGRV